MDEGLEPSMDYDEDIPQLPEDTLRALREFHAERDANAKKFEDLQNQAEDHFQGGSLSMDSFGEDWNTSQFWYTNETAHTLAAQLLKGTDANSCIAVVSAPSVYVALRNILAKVQVCIRPSIQLLEYDKRFALVGPDFIHYDFARPLQLPAELRAKFDCIICDPPFLSEHCQTNTALTVRFLSRRWFQCSGNDSSSGLRLITCTGERMEPLINRLYAKIGVRTTTFEPAHTKGLGNEFRCYANFECEDWHWR